MNKLDYRIAAVVVTFNRLEMLKECVEAIRKQTYEHFDIIVVNNGSTDGTDVYLSSQSDVIVINQENCGGAGGFYTGMKYMYEHDYDALWMMDDDGLPDNHQLEYLLGDSQKYGIDYSNAVVINRKNHLETALHEKYDKEVLEKKGVIYNKVNPFNGTLIWRNVIEKVGFIKKEMFIWGDEVEYTSRVKTNGFKVGTIPRAIHYHPEFKTDFRRIIPFFPRPKIAIKPQNRDKLFFRNLGYLDAKYRKNFLIKYSVYYIIRFKIKEFSYFLKYYRMGYKNNFSENLFA